MINTIIFDLDGTLLNTLDDLKDSTNAMLRQFGCPEKTLEQVRAYVGNGVSKLVERAIPDGVDNRQFQEYKEFFIEHYSKNMYNKTAPYEGINELLAELTQGGYKIAIVSNKFDSAVKELCRQYFSDIQVAIGESETIRKKPASDGILAAIRELGSKREETLYVGDSEVDVQTSKSCGLVCAGVTWGFRSREVLISEGADYTVDTPEELLNLVKTLS